VPLSVKGVTESSKAFLASIGTATGEMVAVNQDTGKIEWDDKLPSTPYGAAAVTGNVVLTTTYSGDLYAFNATTGAVLLKTPMSAATNAPVAIDGDYVIAGAGTPLVKNQPALIIAYKLGADGKLPDTVR
jgi:outer membrane protein assembly factor BamB